MELTLNLGARTITTSKQEPIAVNTLPRYVSDGMGGVNYTGQHTVFEADSCSIIKLPNGKFVISCEANQRIEPDAPFYTKAAYDTRSTSYLGGDFLMQYFDPTLMP